MTIAQEVWGSLLIFLVCPLLGGLPSIDWISYAIAGTPLSRMGTGNVSVSAAFYHCGKLVGVLAVLSEAFKGIAAVLLARAFFPSDPVWELIALIALVVGRYWMGKGAGTTNVVWGIIVHDPIAAGLIFLTGGVSFTIFRERQAGRIGILVLLVVILALRHPHEPELIIAAIALACMLAWIYSKIPDDLDLRANEAKAESQKMFRFFRGDKALISLDNQLDSAKVGQKAATLSQLKRWGCTIPEGWVLPAGDDPQPLIEFLQPTSEQPLVVRSSAIGEDSYSASAAGQYTTVLNVSDRGELRDAILRTQASYHQRSAVQYRRSRQQKDTSMAVLIQKQIRGVFSGVAFSRDPVDNLNNSVVIEALPGEATQVVSGQVTPQQYRVYLPQTVDEESRIEGEGDLNSVQISAKSLLEDIAYLVRDLEDYYHGIPQDIEWTYDGETLWLLQARPITTLQPIWTRKIAAEVIPGLIRPLTWSINRPLTCGVWGEIFTLVLGKRARGLNFDDTATLHYHRAYFNATLLGKIFRRMGLPQESLEFLTRGAKFSKPPLLSTIRNIPGLMRLLTREWDLAKDFERDYQKLFAPTLNDLDREMPSAMSEEYLLERIEKILAVLKRATYYSILAPLSLAIRQAIWQVPETELDNSQTPEVASMRSLARLAADTRNLIPIEQLTSDSCPSVFAAIAEMPDGENVLEQFQQWLDRYGYLSDVATDIAIPRWKENPRPVREIFAQCLLNEQRQSQLEQDRDLPDSPALTTSFVQKRLNLKGSSGEVYSQLLAHLRWSFVALEKMWLEANLLTTEGDIFFLKISEIRRLILDADPQLSQRLSEIITNRKNLLAEDKKLTNIPYVVYGNPPARNIMLAASQNPSQQRLQGIGASPGIAEGRVKILRNLQEIGNINETTILVVPYTDSGWSPVLASAGGLIAEVGGRLSHGAIVAREYGIPAVMDVHNATNLLQNGQRVRIDGQAGIVEILTD
ncbi:MAG: glycerol-3-phosphate acyltransferase [Oscillatoria sp. PMC 1051.18]|nr:glycerol-3-phosphate acyltransferase [Oscillatoria sp. PMC 1050.18]MEC5030586.1 glycerol-3-phosphate acyltransferase [Oscillatoria sp. PMC 1051.18]